MKSFNVWKKAVILSVTEYKTFRPRRDIGNERPGRRAQNEIVTNTLNFGLTDDNGSMNEPKLNRFCNDILSRIQSNTKCLVLETKTKDTIFHTGVCLSKSYSTKHNWI